MSKSEIDERHSKKIEVSLSVQRPNIEPFVNLVLKSK
jgi:hypothetical protein